jgi:hypothetical protein
MMSLEGGVVQQAGSSLDFVGGAKVARKRPQGLEAIRVVNERGRLSTLESKSRQLLAGGCVGVIQGAEKCG